MPTAQPDDANIKGQFSTKPLLDKTSASQVRRGGELFQYVVDRLESGASKQDLCQELIAMGYPAAEAGPWVDKVVAWRKQSEGLPQYPHMPGHVEPGPRTGGGWFGRGHMGIGGLVFLAGIGLTIMDYGAAQKGGGRFYIFSGLIVWGAFQFFLGWWNRNR